MIFGERPQHIDAAAGEQRGDDLEGGILRSGANQPDVSFLHVRQKCVLLRFVETMDFINEDDGPGAILAGAFSVSHDLLDFLYAGQHGRKLNELRFGHASNNLS